MDSRDRRARPARRGAHGRTRNVTLFYGARQHFDLYDLYDLYDVHDLQLLAAAYPALRVIPVLSDEPGYSGLTGQLPEVVHAHGSAMFATARRTSAVRPAW